MHFYHVRHVAKLVDSLIEVRGIANFDDEIHLRTTIHRRIGLHSIDVDVLLDENHTEAGQQTLLIEANDTDLGRERLTFLIVPIHCDEAFRLKILQMRAVGRMYDNATPAADEADHLIARHGLAALGKMNERVFDTLDGDTIRRLFRSFPCLDGLDDRESSKFCL